MAIPTWTTGEVLLSDDVNTWFVPLFAYKTADLSRASHTSQTIDTDLQVSVAASAVYMLEAQIIYSGDATGDMNVGWSYPSGTTGTWGPHGNGTTVIGSSAGLALQANTPNTWGYLIRTEATDISATRDFGATGSGDIYAAHVWGLITTSSTSGTFGLTWGQNGSSATASVLRANSYMSLRRVG